LKSQNLEKTPFFNGNIGKKRFFGTGFLDNYNVSEHPEGRGTRNSIRIQKTMTDIVQTLFQDMVRTCENRLLDCPRLSRATSFFCVFRSNMVKNKGRKVTKRPINRRLSILERGIAAGLSKAGHNQYEVAAQMDCTTKTVRELVKKVDSEKILEDRPRSGRPKKTSPREDRSIKFQSLKNRKLTAKAMALKRLPNLTKNRLSISTVKNRLQVAGLK
jgi:transposase